MVANCLIITFVSEPENVILIDKLSLGYMAMSGPF